LKHKVFLHDNIERDINIIYNFCEIKYGTSYALKIKSNIVKQFNSLGVFPNSNPYYFNLNGVHFRAKLVLNRYHIVYCVLDSLVIIYRVYDGRRNILPSDLFEN